MLSEILPLGKTCFFFYSTCIKLWRGDRILDSSTNTVTRLNRTTRVLFQEGTGSGCYLCHCFRSSSGIRLALFSKGSSFLWVNGRSVKRVQAYASDVEFISARIWWKHVSVLVSVKAYFVIEVWNIKWALLRRCWYLLLTTCPQNMKMSSISASYLRILGSDRVYFEWAVRKHKPLVWT